MFRCIQRPLSSFWKGNKAPRNRGWASLRTLGRRCWKHLILWWGPWGPTSGASHPRSCTERTTELSKINSRRVCAELLPLPAHRGDLKFHSPRDPLPFKCKSRNLRTLKLSPCTPSWEGDCSEKTPILSWAEIVWNKKCMKSGSKQLPLVCVAQTRTHSCTHLPLIPEGATRKGSLWWWHIYPWRGLSI